MGEVSQRSLSGNGEDLNSQLEAFDKTFEFESAADERKKSKRRVWSKSSHSSEQSGQKDAGFVTDSDDEDIQITMHSQNSRLHNNDGALEALMLTPRGGSKTKSPSSSSNGAKSQPLRKSKRGLLKGFKYQMKSSTSLCENPERKADEILLSLTKTRGPNRKSGSKPMSDELWNIAMVSHHDSKHGRDKNHSIHQEGSRHSHASSIRSFAECSVGSDHPPDENPENKTNNLARLSFGSPGYANPKSYITKRRSAHRSSGSRRLEIMGILDATIGDDQQEDDYLPKSSRVLQTSHQSQTIRSSSHSPVGRRGRASRHLRLSNHGNQEAPCEAPLVASKAGAALDRRKHRHELSKSCHGKNNIREAPVSPSLQPKSAAMSPVVDPTHSQVSSLQPRILLSIPQSPSGRRSPARFASTTAGGGGGQNKSRSTSEPRRKESRRMPKSDSSSLGSRRGVVYEKNKSGSQLDVGNRRTSYRQQSEESLQNREIVQQSLKRSKTIANLEEEHRQSRHLAVGPSPSLSTRRRSSTPRRSPPNEVNSTGGGRQTRKPKAVRSALSRKHVV